MKCIKNVMTKEIRRVSDALAYQFETRGWVYVPKSEWKAATRIKATPQIVEAVATEDSVPRRNREKRNKK